MLGEFAGVESLLLGELVDEIDIRVRSMDDQRRLAGLVAAPPPVPLLDHSAHRLRACVVELDRVLLLEDRDGVEAAALIDGDLVVAQPRMNLLGVVGVAVPADLPQLRLGDPLIGEHFGEQAG